MNRASRVGATLLVAALSLAPAAGEAAGRAEGTPLGELLEAYLGIQRALADDALERATPEAGRVERAAARLGAKHRNRGGEVQTAAKAFAASKDLAAAREAFKALSESVIALSATEPVPSRPVSVYRCDMAKARWLQADAEVANPYYGKAMLRCGVKVTGASASPVTKGPASTGH